MAATNNKNFSPAFLHDRYLLLATAILVLMGLLMVASTSISLSSHFYHHPFRYLIHQTACLALGLFLAAFVVNIPVKTWEKISPTLLIIGIILLILVLIPGIGKQVNGSMRWLGAGPATLQVSDLMKLGMVLYLASYLVRHQEEIRTRLMGFIKPMLVLAVISALLLKEPDFGAATVIMATTLGMLFLAGARLGEFLGLLTLTAAAFATLAISSPYRLQRLTSFLNPWANQFDSGYQLTQSLIAFGRGGWFGVGLGGSVQKLFYLPEAHTDFLFAILTEELGLIGALFIIAVYVLLVSRIFLIGRQAQVLQKTFAAYVAYGIGLWIGLQVLINIGVNTGLLPTKGLTLPLMSYGGSSILINCVAIALLLRIDYESRKTKTGLSW
ncbi:MAG: putative lipid II flippase FtsW [Gammaproteobacteria bacterium]|nr:putative lipid II flippase FtsW [Gammaproteobacteria bacterium]